jgi:hypothetical protein
MRIRKPLFQFSAFNLLTLSMCGVALSAIGSQSGLAPQYNQIWVGSTTFSTDPEGDYSGGFGIDMLWAAMVDYWGPSPFQGGSTNMYGAELPNQYAVNVIAANGCVEGWYGVSGEHYVDGNIPGWNYLGSSYYSEWVDEELCS